MKKIKVIKFVAGFIAGAGAARIMGQVIRNNTDPVNGYQRVTMAAGAFVLCGIIGGIAARETERNIDDLILIWKKAKEEAEKQTEN